MSPESRYQRQQRFAPLGAEGQRRISASSVTIVGCGALGSVAAELLARAGVGRLTIIDRDYVEVTNLQRQFLYTERDAQDALPKAEAARRRLGDINGSIVIDSRIDDLTPRNADELLEGAGIIVDATDNFETRYLINDYAVKRGVPWIYGAAVGSYGLATAILPGKTACFRCIYPEPPSGVQPTCETAGVLGSITTLIAAYEANVAIQIASGNAGQLRRVILTADLWHGPVREIHQPARDEQCICCGLRDFEWLEGRRATPVSLCGQNAVQIHSAGSRINLSDLAARLKPAGHVRHNDFALRFQNGSLEMTVFADGRAIVKGTTDVPRARAFCSKWLGIS